VLGVVLFFGLLIFLCVSFMIFLDASSYQLSWSLIIGCFLVFVGLVCLMSFISHSPALSPLSSQ